MVGVNGTAERPNKEREMRSHSVLIGGHYWNIKYYPRGNPNEGTEQLSIYIECSNVKYEDNKSAGPTKTYSHSGSQTQPTAASRRNSENLRGEDPVPLPALTDESQEPQPLEIDSTQGTETPWEVAAQVCCVIYNPEEPRVHVAQRSSHRYCRENNDWGWTRFHGPWDDIHKRQRFKRQALLRNDTLAFTVYIRTIHDDTGALWWHQKDQIEWDSVARIGLKRLVHEASHSSALIAALSAWLYLNPIINVICNISIPDPFTEFKTRIRPLTDALQQLVRENRGSQSVSSSSQPSKISLNNIANIMSWYGEGSKNLKKDVMATWETIRRIISYEASSVENMADASDIFSDVWTLKQSDVRRKHRTTDDGMIGMQESLKSEPCSVQETITFALETDPIAAKMLHAFLGQSGGEKFPSVLQIELNRQSFFPDARRWKRLTHHIKIDETIIITLPSGQKITYILYGMIVHAGALESCDYYSVIRPAGPGTAWLKYAGDKDPKGVTRLTTKQACESHEGGGKTGEGTSPVAYVVSYVLNDTWSEILTGLGTGLSDASNSEDGMISASEIEEHKKAFVQVYGSNIFRLHDGRGIFDPWARALPNHAMNPYLGLEFEFKASDTLAMVEEFLVKLFAESGNGGRFRLWALDTKPQSSIRGTPRLVPSLKAQLCLDELIKSFGGARFWLHIIPRKVAEEMALLDKPMEESLLDKPIEESPSNPILAPIQTLGENLNPGLAAPEQAIQETDTQTSTDEIMQEQEVLDATEGTQQQIQPPFEEIAHRQEHQTWPASPVPAQEYSQNRPGGPRDTQNNLEESVQGEGEHGYQDEPNLIRATLGPLDDPLPRNNDVSLSTEDTDMDEPHDPKASKTERSLSWVTGTEPVQKAHIEMIYFFLKVFNCETGRLHGLGSYFAKKDEKIGDVIRHLFAVRQDEAFDIFHEKSLSLSQSDRVSHNMTFEGDDGTVFFDGSIFVLQRRSSEETYVSAPKMLTCAVSNSSLG